MPAPLGAAEPCRKLLLETKVKSILRPQAPVILTDHTTVEQALRVLADNRILSAPVVVAPPGGAPQQHTPRSAEADGADPAGAAAHGEAAEAAAAGADGRGRDGAVQWPAEAAPADIVGFIDVRSILITFLNGLGDPAAGGSERKENMLSRMRHLEVLGARFAKRTLSSLPNQGGNGDGDFLHSGHAGAATLLELVAYGFLDPKRRGMHEGEAQPQVVHRVALFDSTGRIGHVISQTDIVRFLAGHRSQLELLASTTLHQLGWDRKPVACCTPETPALDAMRLMTQQGVSSVAVVSSSTGRLVGNFSASELRTILAEQFGALALPVGEFLAHEHATEYVAANRERLLEDGVYGSPAHAFVANRMARARPHTPGEDVGQALVLANPETTFAEVMGLLTKNRIHRVYVVDEQMVPIGIVTCTDILRLVVELATVPASPQTTPR